MTPKNRQNNSGSQDGTDQQFLRRVLPKGCVIGHLPNVVIRGGDDVLACVLHAIDRTGGIFLEDPPACDVPVSYDDFAYFVQWSKKENQEYLCDYPCYYPKVVLDAHMNATKLKKFYDCDSSEEELAFLIAHIDEYRWCYTSLSDYVEEPIAIFFCRSLDAPWIERITQKLDHAHIPYTRIVSSGNQDIWKLNDELRHEWRLL
ncbi:MAG: hypothetical protein Q4G59_04150 [Planctomycetia bacterium]|nr:hypothetical protein [Planctomycetia bacterium]